MVDKVRIGFFGLLLFTDSRKWMQYIAKLREELKAGPFFQNLIKKHFLENPHRVVLTMRPGTL